MLPSDWLLNIGANFLLPNVTDTICNITNMLPHTNVYYFDLWLHSSSNESHHNTSSGKCVRGHPFMMSTKTQVFDPLPSPCPHASTWAGPHSPLVDVHTRST